MSDDTRPTWRTIDVGGLAAHYGVAGVGRPVVFLHGWGLSARTYSGILERLAAGGYRVYAPCLPGFGGTASLRGSSVGLSDYAGWVEAFCRAAGIDGPLDLIGHSFGGGVAIRFAHDMPERVAHLVVVNSVGGFAWRDRRGVIRPMRERPLWDWSRHLHAEAGGAGSWISLPRVVRDALPSIVRNPSAVWRAATLARHADLRSELHGIQRRALPMTIVWSEQDTVVPRSAFESLRAAAGGARCVVVAGRHGWLIDDPQRFADAIEGVLQTRPGFSDVRAVA